MRNARTILIVALAASFASAETPSFGFDNGKRGLRVPVKSVSSVPAARGVPADPPATEETDPAEKTALLSLSCSSPEKVKLAGTLDNKTGELFLYDPANSLGVNSLTQQPANFVFKRQARRQGARSSFAQFDCDATEWKMFSFSLPEEIFSGGGTGGFPAYFTVTARGGGTTIPGRAVTMSCVLKSGSDKLFEDCELQTDCKPNEGCDIDGRCAYNSYVRPGGNKCITNRQCHNGNTCENGHCKGLW